ncbi:MAG: aminoglycoside phosphotransferase family protein [Chloroflexia bacterium]
MSDNKDLNYYLVAWNLSNPQLLTQTITSNIYIVAHENETVVLKLLSASETKEQAGALALRYFDGRGAVRLLCYDDGAHLLEYAAGDELVTLVKRGEDENATRIIAQVIKQLHSAQHELPHDGFVGLGSWFGELFRRATADRQAGSESIYVRGAAVAERLLADQREIRVLHGDIHHYNIRQSSRGWLAFDPKSFLVGERTYDCANTLCNPVMTELVHDEARLLRNAAILADTLAIELPRVLEFTYAYACLNASWWLLVRDAEQAEEIIEWSLKVAMIIEPHIERL